MVGIHSDASARKLKGAGPPILTERARAVLVAALEAVNYVIIFDDFEVTPLLRELHPDMHASGADGAPDAAPELNLAALLGIRVAALSDRDQHSTREIMARVRRPIDG